MSYFVIQNQSMKTDRPTTGKGVVSIRMDNKLILDLEEVAKHQHRNFSNLSIAVLRDYLDIATHPDGQLLKNYNDLVATVRKKYRK